MIERCTKIMKAAIATKGGVSVPQLTGAMMIISGIRIGTILSETIVVEPGSASHSITFKKDAEALPFPETPLLCEASLFIKAVEELKRMQGNKKNMYTTASKSYNSAVSYALRDVCTISDARWIFIALCYEKHAYKLDFQNFVDWVSHSSWSHSSKIPVNRPTVSPGSLVLFDPTARAPIPRPSFSKRFLPSATVPASSVPVASEPSASDSTISSFMHLINMYSEEPIRVTLHKAAKQLGVDAREDAPLLPLALDCIRRIG